MKFSRVWSGNITPHKASLLAQLKLPSETGPRRWWLTEFEDQWPYAPAPGDVTFSRSRDQSAKQRYAVTGGGADPLLLGFALFATGAFVRRRVRGI